MSCAGRTIQGGAGAALACLPIEPADNARVVCLQSTVAQSS